MTCVCVEHVLSVENYDVCVEHVLSVENYDVVNCCHTFGIQTPAHKDSVVV